MYIKNSLKTFLVATLFLTTFEVFAEMRCSFGLCCDPENPPQSICKLGEEKFIGEMTCADGRVAEKWDTCIKMSSPCGSYYTFAQHDNSCND